MSKTVVFELDDFQLGNAIENLQRIKDHFPKFKCTMFMIPMNVSIVTGDIEQKKYEEWTSIVKDYDWIELALHGFAHMGHEGDVKTKEDAENLVKGAENTMKVFNLPFQKIWKSPFWVSSDVLLEYLRDNDYIVAVDKNQPLPKIEGLKLYVYNWSIDRPAPNEEVLKAHGHAYGTPNDIGLCLGNVMREMPINAEFKFISEYYAKYE